MRFKKNLLAKITAQVLIFVVLFNSLAMPLAFAQEALPEPTGTPAPEVSPEPTATVAPLPTDTPADPTPTVQAVQETPSPTETPAVTEITPSPTETPSPSNPSDSPSPSDSSPTATPTPQSTIDTGDASSSTTTDITANKNEDTINGSLSTPSGDCTPPEGRTTCGDDLDIDYENQAGVGNSASSSATTGGNESSGNVGGASIDTGNATATGDIKNEVNTNITTLDPGNSSATPTPSLTVTPTETPTETPPPVPSSEGLNIPGPDCSSPSGPANPSDPSNPSPTPTPVTLAIDNSNGGSVKNDVSVSATTGDNVASDNMGSVDVTTGDGVAWANLLNLLNTNILGSNFEILFLNIKNENKDEFKEINLNEIWKKLQYAQETNSLVLGGGEQYANVRLIVRNYNLAGLENKVNICVVTGQNTANDNQGGVDMQTGTATALANVNNFVNTNIIGSKFFFGVINILDPFSGNIILPRPERFYPQEETEGGNSTAEVNSSSSAEVTNDIKTTADTGGNQSNSNNGSDTTVTGSATAISQSFTLANLSFWKNNWFYLWLNSLGNWDGKTMGWLTPDSVQDGKGGMSEFFEIGGSQSAEDSSSTLTPTPDPSLIVDNQNQAEVKNEIQVTAVTGDNQANNNGEDVNLWTGDAKAIANLLNFINLNIVGSRWFLSLINVMAKWSGNTIFAYPDLAVTLSADKNEVNAGDSLQFTLSYVNEGYDEAKDATVKIELPLGVTYLDDSSGEGHCLRQICVWNVGNLARGAGGAIVINAKVNDDFWSIKETSFLQRLIPVVFAADNVKEVASKAFIAGLDPEPDINNNESIKVTQVKMPEVGGVDLSQVNQESTDQVDQRQPVIEITAKNNVGEYVYPEDTVTFEITIRNQSEVAVEDAKFVQDLYNGIPGEFGVVEIYLGKIEPGKGGVLSFGIKLDPSIIHTGKYHSVGKVVGYASNGDQVTSNEARTEFNVRERLVTAKIQPATAAEEKQLILGEKSCDSSEKILPYILLLVLSAWSLAEKTRRFFPELKKEEEQ